VQTAEYNPVKKPEESAVLSPLGKSCVRRVKPGPPGHTQNQHGQIPDAAQLLVRRPSGHVLIGGVVLAHLSPRDLQDRAGIVTCPWLLWK